MSNDVDPAFLDVEDDEQRQKRLGALLERLNTTSPLPSAAPDTLLNIGHERPLGPIEPPSELLARVQAFLPAISASNEALSLERPEDIDIENVAEGEDRYIQMNLGLGVFEAKRRPESESRSPMSSDAESDMTSGSDSDSSSSCSEDDSESDSDYSFGEDSDEQSKSALLVDIEAISSRPIKPLPRRVSQQAKPEV